MATNLERHLLNALGGRERTVKELQNDLDVSVHRATVHRLLSHLVASGEAERVAHGRYRRPGRPPLLSEDGQRVLRVVEGLAPDAHLTGFDVLAPYAHQLIAEYPHLVYVEPASADTAAFRLAEAGFLVVRAGGRRNNPAFRSQPGQTVVLRVQPNADRYGVHGPLAPREKAWVDTLRETERGLLPFDYVELGRVLRALLDDGGDVPKLRNYARRMGYLARVNAALGNATESPASAELDALRAGFLS